MENLSHSTARVGCDFLLQIGILSAKDKCDLTPQPPKTLSLKVVIVGL